MVHRRTRRSYVGNREARAGRLGCELVHRIAAGAPICEFLLVETLRQVRICHAASAGRIAAG
jgi:hypothetical protein